LNLKKLRITISTTVFILFVLAFQGDEKISTALSSMLLYFQFTPSLLQFIHSPGHLLGLGFLLLLLASFIFGRFYCSFLSLGNPSGYFYQDFKRFSKKAHFSTTVSPGHVLFTGPNSCHRYSRIVCLGQPAGSLQPFRENRSPSIQIACSLDQQYDCQCV